MTLLELIRNGGPLAMAAAAAGLAGQGLGLIAVTLVLVKSKAALGLAVFTLFFGSLAAGLGIAGTVIGKRQVDALLPSLSAVDAELIRLAGYQEAQGAALVGFFAALLPLLLGAVAIFGARLRSKAAIAAVTGMLHPRKDSTATVSLAAFVFVAIGALVAAGAWLMSRQPMPVGRHGLALGDDEGWELARALDEVASNPERGCHRLDAALRPIAGRPQVPTLQWHDAATLCVGRWVKNEPASVVLSNEGMLSSPLLFNGALVAQVRAAMRQRNDAPAGP